MLDSTTKKRIDDARDTLVGKLPDPKSQVEQITIALIYKFMDDMDRASVKLGGKAKFFSGAFKDYAWDKVFDTKLAGHEIVKAYGDAIQQLDKNPNVPQLFRNIFKNAYLPYRDPETLKSFLTIIDEFEYDHSEKLGDAFEYLLSVLGSQGELGQFRTPRHIIDFIVSIVNPQKNEKILDPACGTAGFLISAYKHVLKHNSKNYSPAKDPRNFALQGVDLNEVVIENKDFSGDKLSSDDRARLVKNISGYDISPDMIRLSLVNLYLHGFPDPNISEYDTLTSEDRWNEYADVILANPPFMSPKGGIKPHKRFSIQSNRSEVLFVDYMLEHLSATGRAGIIVPEGIVFNAQNAFSQIRKTLVEKYLVAVVSLPAGVFNPYSGVKTSILIIDKALSKKAKAIAFFRVENDGFDLGAQRRAINKNDLPKVFDEVNDYLRRVREAQSLRGYEPKLGLIVEKEKIAATIDYNLSREHYNETSIPQSSQYPYKELGELCTIRTGKKDVNSGNKDGKYPFFTCAKEPTYSDVYSFDTEAILIAGNGDVGAVQYYSGKFEAYQRTYVLSDWIGVESRYLFFSLKGKLKNSVSRLKLGNTMPYIKLGMLSTFKIPIPPAHVQKAIVEEIENYQNIINGARAIIENYQPHIQINPEWPTIQLSEVILGKPKNGYSGKPVDYETNLKVLSLSATTSGKLNITKYKYLDESISQDSPCRCKKGDIYLQRGNTAELVGTAALFDVDDNNFIYPDLMIRVQADERKVLSNYLLLALQSEQVRTYLKRNAVGAAGSMPKINQGIVEKIPLKLPPIAEQESIVREIQAEQTLVNANQQLISIFEKKIQATLNRVWE